MSSKRRAKTIAEKRKEEAEGEALEHIAQELAKAKGISLPAPETEKGKEKEIEKEGECP